MFTTDSKVIDDIKKAKFVVFDYDWKTFDRPRKELFEGSDLHFSGFPRLLFERDVIEIINSRLSFLSANKCKGKYSLDISLLDRETGNVSGYGNIFFDKTTPMLTKNLAKLLLHNMRIVLDNGSRINISCMWNKQRGIIPRKNNTYKKVLTVSV
uniref:Uncharacterized protein n=1 Tax=Pithovirus LCDPAC01 TaxID=2506600 RepID=A0A481YQH1_9VIRU|nr:MAG: hypothetical protein LCDPAC01_01520 [Pithovirus LCDPAC01]